LVRSVRYFLIDDRHRADGDGKATVKLFEKILAEGGMEHIDKNV
jgi:hypothetical protein